MGRIVHFVRKITLASPSTQANLYFSADTRYKLFVNGERVAVGPTRSSPLIWYYDSLDIAPYLKPGENEIRFSVLRYFASSRGAMAFERTALPGLTIVGHVEAGDDTIDLGSHQGWKAAPDESVQFPSGLVDDVFLHVSTAGWFPPIFLMLILPVFRLANASLRRTQLLRLRRFYTVSKL